MPCQVVWVMILLHILQTSPEWYLSMRCWKAVKNNLSHAFSISIDLSNCHNYDLVFLFTSSGYKSWLLLHNVCDTFIIYVSQPQSRYLITLVIFPINTSVSTQKLTMHLLITTKQGILFWATFCWNSCYINNYTYIATLAPGS